MNEKEQALRLRVSQTLIRLGVPMNQRGYEYLREAILLSYTDAELPIKAVLTHIAAQFGVSTATVMRGCRSVTVRAYESGCPAHFDGYDDAAPGDSERFIQLTAEKLRIGEL